MLVSVEVGLSAMCLIAGGLLLHSFVKLLRVDKGFGAERVVTVDLNLPASRYPNFEKREAFVRTLVARVSAVPGVIAAGRRQPVTARRRRGKQPVVAARAAICRMMERPLVDIRDVNPEYFAR